MSPDTKAIFKQSSIPQVEQNAGVALMGRLKPGATSSVGLVTRTQRHGWSPEVETHLAPRPGICRIVRVPSAQAAQSTNVQLSVKPSTVRRLYPILSRLRESLPLSWETQQAIRDVDWARDGERSIRNDRHNELERTEVLAKLVRSLDRGRPFSRARGACVSVRWVKYGQVYKGWASEYVPGSPSLGLARHRFILDVSRDGKLHLGYWGPLFHSGRTGYVSVGNPLHGRKAGAAETEVQKKLEQIRRALAVKAVKASPVDYLASEASMATSRRPSGIWSSAIL